jgi:hypothetical protein
MRADDRVPVAADGDVRSILKGKRLTKSFAHVKASDEGTLQRTDAETCAAGSGRDGKQMLVKILVIGNPKCGKTSTIQR